MNPSKESSQPFPQVTPFTDTGGTFTLKDAVNAFITDREAWAGGNIYGQDISDWDVSQAAMFSRATVFDQDIGDWDVSSGTLF
eukprot:scaffold141796_cov23-Attheya_sp.AAC.1